jgi:hypothetical protein
MRRTRSPPPSRLRSLSRSHTRHVTPTLDVKQPSHQPFHLPVDLVWGLPFVYSQATPSPSRSSPDR